MKHELLVIAILAAIVLAGMALIASGHGLDLTGWLSHYGMVCDPAQNIFGCK